MERASPDFVEQLTASADEVDELGHVSNIAYVRWVQEVAKSHSRAVGWDHAAYVRLGAVFVVRKHEIEYLAPVYAGDRVELTTWIAGWSAATSERRTRIARAEDGREICRASTLWALVAIATGRPRRVPPEIASAFAGPR